MGAWLPGDVSWDGHSRERLGYISPSRPSLRSLAVPVVTPDLHGGTWSGDRDAPLVLTLTEACTASTVSHCRFLERTKPNDCPRPQEPFLASPSTLGRLETSHEKPSEVPAFTGLTKLCNRKL